MIFVKLIFWILLAVYGVVGSFQPQLFAFLDGANLLFHEAGHVFFGLLGQYLGIWGGTLLQLLFPLGIAIGFLKQKSFLSAMVMFYWFGENFVFISNYVKDARAQALPLVGGEIHDWHFILGRAGLLEYDQVIAGLVWLLGLLIMLGSSLIGGVITFQAGEKKRA